MHHFLVIGVSKWRLKLANPEGAATSPHRGGNASSVLSNVSLEVPERDSRSGR